MDFMEQLQTLIEKVGVVVSPYLALDKTLPEGLDTRFKFTNDRNGVPNDTIKLLDETVDLIKAHPNAAERLSLDDITVLMDALVLFSNHLDQSPVEIIRKMPKLAQDDIGPITLTDPIEINKKRKLYWLKTCEHLAQAQGPIAFLLEEKKYRYLSILALALHYLGKALHDSKVAEEKIKSTEYKRTALELAKILEELKVPENIHYYEDQFATFTWPVVYDDMNEERYQQALQRIDQLVAYGITPFHTIQAENQYATIYKALGQLDKALEHGLKADEVYKSNNNITVALWLNTQVILMDIYFRYAQFGKYEARDLYSSKAKQLAELIMKHPIVRPHQLKQAQFVIDGLLPITNQQMKVKPHDVDNTSIYQKFMNLGKSLEDKKQDLALFADFLACSVEVTKKGSVTETKINHPATYGKNSHPDCIFVFGNNDLPQIDFLAKQIRQYHPQGSVPIIISGQGGHGTINGPISKFSEASTFAKRLRELGIKNPILMEQKATDTGKNIQFTEAMIKEIAQQTGKMPKNVWVCATFSSARRQLRSLAQQTKMAWDKMYILPPSSEEIQKIYCKNDIDANVNLLGTLREMLSILDYLARTNYVLPIPFSDIEALKTAYALTMDYLEGLTHKPLKQEANLHLQALLTNQVTEPTKTFFKEHADYFRKMFSMAEQECMQNLSDKDIANLHTQSMFFNRDTYARLGIDPVEERNRPSKPSI